MDFIKNLLIYYQSFGVIFLSVTIEKQVKSKTCQWQPKNALKKLKDHRLQREDPLQSEDHLLEEQQVKDLLRDLQVDVEDKIKVIACKQAIILIF